MENISHVLNNIHAVKLTRSLDTAVVISESGPLMNSPQKIIKARLDKTLVTATYRCMTHVLIPIETPTE